MSWGNVAGLVFRWLMYAALTLTQVSLLANYSWKDTGNPQSYFGAGTLRAIHSLWSRNMVVWTLYSLSLFFDLARVIQGSLRLAGIPGYVGWPVGLVGFAATEIAIYKGRGFL